MFILIFIMAISTRMSTLFICYQFLVLFFLGNKKYELQVRNVALNIKPQIFRGDTLILRADNFSHRPPPEFIPKVTMPAAWRISKAAAQKEEMLIPVQRHFLLIVLQYEDYATNQRK